MLVPIVAYQIQKQSPTNLVQLLQRTTSLSPEVKATALSMPPTYQMTYDSQDEKTEILELIEPLAENLIDFRIVVESYSPPESVLVLVRTHEDWQRFVEFCAEAPLFDEDGEGPISGAFDFTLDDISRKNPKPKKSATSKNGTANTLSEIKKIAQVLEISEFSQISPSPYDDATVLTVDRWFRKVPSSQGAAWNKWEKDSNNESSNIESTLSERFPNLIFNALIDDDGSLSIRVRG
jgi:hypothetical protein